MAIIGKTRKSQSSSDESKRLAQAKETQERTTSGGVVSDLTGGLPGRVRAEKAIQAREPAKDFLDKAINEASSADGFLESTKAAGKVGLGALGLANERIQGFIAGPAFELQDPFRKDILSEVMTAAGKGLSGDRPVEFGDLARSRMSEVEIGGVDVTEPLSAMAGLMLDVGVGVGIAKKIKGIFTGGKNALNNVDKAWRLSNEARDKVGSEIGKQMTGKMGQGQVNANMLSKIVNDIPDATMRKIRRDPKVFKVRFDADGNVVPTVENTWRFRMALDDTLTSKDFADKATSIMKSGVKKGAGDVRGLIRNTMQSNRISTVDDTTRFLGLMDQFSDYSTKINNVRNILFESGRLDVPKASKAMSFFGGSPGRQKALREFADTFQSGNGMLRSLKEYNRNRNILKATGVGVGGLLLKKLLKDPAREVVGGDKLPNTGGDN